MKKNIIIILGMLLVIGVSVVACCNKSTDDREQQKTSEPAENQFDAKVIELCDEYIMVEALEGQEIAGEVRVQTGLLSEDEIPELKNGDTVCITHDGKMTMSLPPQMTAVDLLLIK